METSNPEKSGWHRQDIIAAVRKKGSTLAEIARSVGLSRQSMYWATISPHVRANRAIAEFLGLPLATLWPQWFADDGTPIPQNAPSRVKPQPISARSYASRPRRVAA